MPRMYVLAPSLCEIVLKKEHRGRCRNLFRNKMFYDSNLYNKHFYVLVFIVLWVQFMLYCNGP